MLSMEKTMMMQVTMLVLIALGFLVKKIGIVGSEGQKNITDLVMYLILPCNIVKSFLLDTDDDIFRQFALILVISLLIQVFSSLFGRLIYRHSEDGHHKTLQYGLICSNAGFLGNPVAEGAFGAIGLAMASVYLIPMRIVMWSTGLAIFAGSSDKKATLKKVATHPCILAVLIGVVIMVFRIPLPALVTNCVETVGNCNTALSMMVIGMILAQADLRTLFDREIFFYSFLRLIAMPLIVYLGCLLFHIPSIVTGVSVLLTAMPSAATTSILASKYNCNELFATRMVVGSTLLSMVTIPVWNIILA